MTDGEPTSPRGYKSDEERGEFGVWLLKAMGDMSPEQLAKAMQDRGHVHTANYYTAMAAGSKQPGRLIRRALEAYFGAAPPPPAVERNPDPVAAAIVDQTEMLRQLVEETRKTRVAQETTAKALGELAGLVAKALRREGTQGAPELQDLVDTRR